MLTNLGAVAVDTGIFTGRSPKDKYIVRDNTARDTFWWADKGKGKNDNKPLSPETWQHLKGLVTKQLSGKRLLVADAFCGANPDTSLPVRFITEVAWQAHLSKTCLFARAMKSWQVSTRLYRYERREVRLTSSGKNRV